MMSYYGYGWSNMMSGLGTVGAFFGVVFWILLIWGIVAFLRGSGHLSHCHLHGGHSSYALDILKERYAKGEIDKKEFDEKRKDLE